MMVDDPMVGGCDRSIPVTIVGYRAAGTAELGAKSLWTVPELWKTRRPRPGRECSRISSAFPTSSLGGGATTFSHASAARGARRPHGPQGILDMEKKKKNEEIPDAATMAPFTDGG